MDYLEYPRNYYKMGCLIILLLPLLFSVYGYVCVCNEKHVA